MINLISETDAYKLLKIKSNFMDKYLVIKEKQDLE